MESEYSFNIQGSRIARAVRFADLFRVSLLSRLQLPFLVCSVLLFFFFFMGENLDEKTLSLFLGGSLLSLGFFGIVYLLNQFTERLKNQAGEAVSFALAKIVLHAKTPTSSELLDVFLRESPEASFVFSRALLSISQLRQILKEQKPEKDASVQEILQEAQNISRERGHARVEVGDALVALAKHNPFLRRILVEENLTGEDIQNLAEWFEKVQKESTQRKKFWIRENLRRYGSLGKNWTSGFSITLDAFSRDLTEEARIMGFPRSVGHQSEVQALERALAKEGTTNVLLVGQPGSGRRSILLELAGKSQLGESLPEVNYKRVLELDLAQLLSYASSPEESEALLQEVFSDVVKAGNIILMVERFHDFVGGEARPGALDITGILSSYLNLTKFRFVALTSYEGLHRNIEQNAAVLSLFEKIEVQEISERHAVSVLQDLAPSFERKYKRFISYPAIRDIAHLSAEYIQDSPLPRKAISLLDESMAHLAQTKDTILLPSHVASLVSQKTQIPVGQMDSGERDKLLNLEQLIHERLINQEQAVSSISSALRRVRSQVASRKGPMGSFLFLGPTGVGKTETAKALAAIYFGSESRMIRLDMSEFQSATDVARLLGTTKEPGLLTTPVREDPFSIVLLDELEKAHSSILNLFLQVLDEGHITDGMGRKVSFKNTIIIATSNAGYQLILKAIEEKEDFAELKEDILAFLFREGIYRPEFLNRFTELVIFAPLTKENLLDIAQLMLNSLKKNLVKQGIEFVITEALKAKIAELGYDPKFGARPMKRVIQANVENAFATALLKGEVKRGDKVQVNPEDFSIQVML
ncbi:MAG: ATP-dependent Clp protease ATP-binding subunit [Candidatus Yanofskybacteria bacterium]|nr:ATP-dependent Clp protease ATP-binding subunit [Candidatus Yanofskybacteria bacterium]